jgi:hypothetical protein
VDYFTDAASALDTDKTLGQLNAKDWASSLTLSGPRRCVGKMPDVMVRAYCTEGSGELHALTFRRPAGLRARSLESHG